MEISFAWQRMIDKEESKEPALACVGPLRLETAVGGNLERFGLVRRT